MPYKKYIYRNGKRYGPYVYHSRRVNGKVVSEYHGQKSVNPIYRNLFLALIFVSGVLFLFYLFVYVNNSFVGRTIIGLDAEYIEGEPLVGNLRLSLKEGELLPASTKLILQT